LRSRGLTKLYALPECIQQKFKLEEKKRKRPEHYSKPSAMHYKHLKEKPKL